MSGRISWEGWAVTPGHEAAGHGQEDGQAHRGCSCRTAAEEQANFANGQEKLHLLMADDRIPAGAKLYR